MANVYAPPQNGMMMNAGPYELLVAPGAPGGGGGGGGGGNGRKGANNKPSTGAKLSERQKRAIRDDFRDAVRDCYDLHRENPAALATCLAAARATVFARYTTHPFPLSGALVNAFLDTLPTANHVGGYSRRQSRRKSRKSNKSRKSKKSRK